MGTVEVEAAIWKKLHDTRYEHVEQARRARDAQANLEIAGEVLEEYREEVLYLHRVLGILRA
jgi:hypothetical protein